MAGGLDVYQHVFEVQLFSEAICNPVTDLVGIVELQIPIDLNVEIGIPPP